MLTVQCTSRSWFGLRMVTDVVVPGGLLRGGFGGDNVRRGATDPVRGAGGGCGCRAEAGGRTGLLQAGRPCAEEALLRRADSAKPNPKGAQASAWLAPTWSRGERFADGGGVGAEPCRVSRENRTAIEGCGSRVRLQCRQLQDSCRAYP